MKVLLAVVALMFASQVIASNKNVLGFSDNGPEERTANPGLPGFSDNGPEERTANPGLPGFSDNGPDETGTPNP